MFYLNKKNIVFYLLCIAITSNILLQSAVATGTLGKISDSSFYSGNALYVVGEVQNTGDVALQNTKVKVIFYDNLNQVINSSTGYTDLNVILVRRKSFFSIRLLESEGSLNVKNYTIWFNWTDAPAGKPEGLVILSSNESIDSDGHKHVSGQIQNQGTVNSNNTEVSATFYNSSGTVIGTAWCFSSPANLEPNQIGKFDIELIYTQQVAKIAGFSLTAESNSLSFSPTSLTSPSPPPSTTTSTSNSPSSTITPSTSPISTTSPFTSPTATSTISSNPTTIPQTTSQPTAAPSNSPTATPKITNQPSQSTSPTDPLIIESQAPLIAAIALAIILVIVGIFVIFWSKKTTSNKSS